jgi:hypothetical protein
MYAKIDFLGVLDDDIFVWFIYFNGFLENMATNQGSRDNHMFLLKNLTVEYVSTRDIDNVIEYICLRGASE